MIILCVCEHRADVTCLKVPVLSHLSVGHSTRRFVACQYAFWQIPVFNSCFYDFLSTLVSSLVIFHEVHFSSKSNGWCKLIQMYVQMLCDDHSYYLSLLTVINFPIAATSTEVGYTPKDPKLLNNMCNCSQRNIKLLVDSLIPFTFNMLDLIISSDNPLLSFLWSMFSVVHTTECHLAQ